MSKPAVGDIVTCLHAVPCYCGEGQFTPGMRGVVKAVSAKTYKIRPGSTDPRYDQLDDRLVVDCIGEDRPYPRRTSLNYCNAVKV